MKYFFLLSLMIGSLSAFGQRTETVINRLAVPGPEAGAQIVVIEKGNSTSVINSLQGQKTPAKVNGYRISIFADNKQNSREAASAVAARFLEMFPDIPVFQKYDVPYFKVTVGNCITSEEATVLWGKIKNSFGKAVVVREEISLAELVGE